MASTSDAILRGIAESKAAEADALLGISPLSVVSGDFWHDMADRLRRTLDRVRPSKLGAEVGARIRDAARAGLHDVSEASADARDKLRGVASAAMLLASLPLLLLFVLPLIGAIKLGRHPRVQRTARRYVAARYGF